MFYVLSKTAGFLAVPSNDLLLLLVAGLVAMAARFARLGRALLIVGVVLLALAGLSPLGNALMLPLEQRFPAATLSDEPPTGIIVLGGAVTVLVANARGEVALNEAAERVVAMAALTHRYPNARIVYSGGNPNLLDSGPGEAVSIPPLMQSLGIAAGRIEIEDRSRNTWQNAVMTRDLVRPKPGERWLLVTSAYHMPRAVGCFRRAGMDVVPYPVDWRTIGSLKQPLPFAAVSEGLARTDAAVREWIGLLIYWLSDRTGVLLPGPD
jgi:uncharacterized SAM-binding protein YcdF (DUF218 family)